MKTLFIYPLSALLLLLFACENYVQNVDPLIDKIKDQELNDPSQIPFLIAGVKQRFATTASDAAMLAGGLSDELIFDSNSPEATYPSYAEIESGDISLDNNSVDAVFSDIGELQFFASDLIRRVAQMSNIRQALKTEAQFTGYLYGGIARYFMAAYFALRPDQGGGTLGGGPFIPSGEMYNQSITQFKKALERVDLLENNASYYKRVVSSLIARCYLYQTAYAGQIDLSAAYQNAAYYAEKGMQENDPDFSAQYNFQTVNAWYAQAGNGRLQWAVNPQYFQYARNDLTQKSNASASERIRLEIFRYRPPYLDTLFVFYKQNMYPQKGTSFPLMSWQENTLILAELVLAGNQTQLPLSAVNYANKARTFFGLNSLSTLDMNKLIEERQRTLFCTGARLIDQRRFRKLFPPAGHLRPGSWQYLPIPERERNSNPNLK